MVQGSTDIHIMDMKPPSITKSIKVAVPTEEQKRLAQLSHIERIDHLEDSIIQRMVEITNHTYEECAMELAGTNMDMESAITNIIEGNSEAWETTKKKVRPEKKTAPPPPTEPTDTRPKRSASKPERGGRRSEEPRTHDSGDRSRSTRTRGGSTRGVSTRGGTSSRGRGGKRQLPPRMDRQRNSHDSPQGRDTYRSSGSRGGGRPNGSYRHNNRGAKRPSEHEPDWGEEESSTNYSTEWKEDGWEDGWNSTNTTTETTTDSAWTVEPTQPKEDVVEETVTPEVTSSWQEGSSSHFSELTHKRPAYTQAFNNPLTAMLSSAAEFSATSNSYTAFTQSQSGVSNDYDTRHEQAPGALLSLQETFNKSSGGTSNSSGNQAGRKISVEQLFQMHEKSNGTSPATIEECTVPASPPTSSTSSTNSGRKSKRVQRTIPSEPVEMPGSAVESLNVQFGSIGFLDNAEEEEKTPTQKSDAATSTTPHAVEPTAEVVSGILQVSKEEPVKLRQLQSTPTTIASSPPRSVYQSTSVQQPTHQAVSVHQASTAHQSTVHQSTSHQSTPHQSPSVHGASMHQAAPPNLPPPNIDNIRTANNLITNHQEEQNFGSLTQSKKSLPPGVYPASRSSLYYNDNQHNALHPMQHQSQQGSTAHQQQQQQQQQMQQQGYDMSRYYASSSSGSFDMQQHHQQRQVQQDSSFGQDKHASQHAAQHGTQHSTQHGAQHSVQHGAQHGAAQTQQHYREMQQMSSQAGSGISSTSTAPAAAAAAAAGLGTTGYPPLLGHYYPHPMHHPYPNSLYANYYHPFNPALNFAQQTQKQTHNVQSYPATNSFTNTAADTTSSPFGQYDEYKDLYAPSANTKHPAHVPVTSSNEYTKMMSDKNMFNMGYMFPNYMQQFQQAGQGQAAAMMQQGNLGQRGMEQSRGNPGAGSISTPKHYWSHR